MTVTGRLVRKESSLKQRMELTTLTKWGCLSQRDLGENLGKTLTMPVQGAYNATEQFIDVYLWYLMFCNAKSM